MDMDVVMRQLILESAAVVTMVTGRVYPGQLPDDVTLPAVVYEAISDVPTYTNDVAHNRQECRRVMRYEVNSYGSKLATARQLDQAIRERLSGFKGSGGGHQLAIFRQSSYAARYEDEDFWRVITDYTVHVGG
jgi:hypothetical protein